MALAGCSSGEETEYESGNGNGDTDSEENGDEDDSPDEDKLVIREHELVIEDEGEPLESVTVEGIVENNSDEQASYVEVSVRVFDADGNQLDSYIANTTDLDGGSTWAFEVMIFEDSEDIDDYDIAVEDITF